VLGAPISYFFEGLGHASVDGMGDRGDEAINDFLQTEEGAELARMFPLVPTGRLRQRVLELVRSVVETKAGSPIGEA